MILKLNGYNPLPAITTHLPYDKKNVSTKDLDMIQHELFRAGITCETEEEFEQVLQLLKTIEIL